MRPFSTESLARASSRQPWLLMVIWLGLVLGGLVCIYLFLGQATSGDRVLRGTDSARGTELIDERLPDSEAADELVVVRSDTLTADDAAFRREVERITREIDATGVARATNVYEDPRAALVSADKSATTIPVRLLSRDSNVNEEKVNDVIEVVDAADGRAGLDVEITGTFSLDRDMQVLAQDDLKKGELFFGLPVALVILVLVFGALVGAAVPILVAIMSIVLALGLVSLIGQAWPQEVFVVNMITGMGLALGIDYSLFVVARYREERVADRDRLEAIAAAGATSSRAVFFSGLVFVVSLLGMLIVPDTVLRSLALGAIVVGIASVLCALTFLPALLSLLGDRVNALRVPFLWRAALPSRDGEGRFWGRIARVVMRRPVISLVAGTALLLALAYPVLDLRIRDMGGAVYPDRMPSKQGFLALNEAFPELTAEPAQIVINGDVRSQSVQAAIRRLQLRLKQDGTYGPASLEVNRAGDLGVLSVPLPGEPEGDPAIAALSELRNQLIPAAFSGVDAEVVVAGATADAKDAGDITNRWLPIVFAFVLGISFVMLMIAFRSVVVPLKAIVLNLLSVGAAYGLMVLVFQKGVAADFLGFQQVETIASWVPTFLFAVLFGLSMDYHVFLLSRIRERFGITGNNTEAVARGVSSSARIITGAAMIMIAVFIGFAVGDLVMFQRA